MKFLKERFFKEPLLHFLLIGVALFFIYYISVDHNTLNKSQDLIIVSNTDIERLTLLFKKTWNRNPTPQELKGLIDDYVKEEILYREALKLGLDKDDTIVRRRMRQKMEFFINDISTQTEPDDIQLEKFLKDNSEKFKLEGQLSFYQVFFSPENNKSNQLERISDLKDNLNNNNIPIENANIYSESKLLPFYMSEVNESEISKQFGANFKDSLLNQKPKIWVGPIESGYGYHLVYIDEHLEEYIPKLSEIRRLVEEEWKYELNKKLEEKYFQEKIKQYKVEFDWPEENKKSDKN